jgi:sugar lactone lactonase YvrE
MRFAFVFFSFLLFNINISSQIISTIAGSGFNGYSGDGGPATSAAFSYPKGICFDGSGNLYIAGWNNCRIRKVLPSGIITSVAGNGSWGYSGDGGPATSAQIGTVYEVACDASGNLYFADYYHNVVRKVDASGIITTIAGNGINGHFGDGGLATSASLFGPKGLTFDKYGNLYISEMNYIRKVNTSGIITSIAGNGSSSGGDGGPATSAGLDVPHGMTTDTIGNLYIVDQGNNSIRKINSSGIITTIAGSGAIGYSGDGGPAVLAKLYYPYSIAIDPQRNLYITDTWNHVIRKIDTNGIITTVAGNGTNAGTFPGSFSGDGGPAILAGLDMPMGIASKGSDLYISDGSNHRIRLSNTPLGVNNNIMNNANIQCYPNPFNTRLEVVTAGNGTFLISVFDLFGKQIYSAYSEKSQTTIDLKDQPNGMYLLNVWDGKNSYVRKITKH